MAARTNEVMAVPVDPDAGVRESFVPAIERDVVINLGLVVFRVLFGAAHPGFFVGGKQKDQIAFGLDLCRVERANRGEQRFDVSRIVANAGCINPAVAHSSLDLEAGLKDRVQVSIKYGDWTTTGSFAGSDEITGGVVTDLQLVFAKQAFNKPGAFLFLFRRRVDLSDGDPLAQDSIAVLVDVIDRGFHARVVLDRFYLIGRRLCLRRNNRQG